MTKTITSIEAHLSPHFGLGEQATEFGRLWKSLGERRHERHEPVLGHGGDQLVEPCSLAGTVSGCGPCWRWTWRLDRLGRTTHQLVNLLEQFERESIRLRSLQDGIDPASVMGRTMLQIGAVFAEMERNLLRERTKAGR